MINHPSHSWSMTPSLKRETLPSAERRVQMDFVLLSQHFLTNTPTFPELLAVDQRLACTFFFFFPPNNNQETMTHCTTANIKTHFRCSTIKKTDRGVLTLVPDFIGLPKSQLRYRVWFSVS